MGIQQFISSVCVETAVYWAPGSKDGYGNNVWSEGTEIRVRWDDKIEKIVDKYGKEILSQAQLLITQDIDIEGFLYKGTLASLETAQRTNPKSVANAYPIMRYERSPEFKSTTKFVRVVYL